VLPYFSMLLYNLIVAQARPAFWTISMMRQVGPGGARSSLTSAGVKRLVLRGGWRRTSGILIDANLKTSRPSITGAMQSLLQHLDAHVRIVPPVRGPSTPEAFLGRSGPSAKMCVDKNAAGRRHRWVRAPRHTPQPSPNSTAVSRPPRGSCRAPRECTSAAPRGGCSCTDPCGSRRSAMDNP